jgi:hypothetical protein
MTCRLYHLLEGLAGCPFRVNHIKTPPLKWGSKLLQNSTSCLPICTVSYPKIWHLSSLLLSEPQFLPSPHETKGQAIFCSTVMSCNNNNNNSRAQCHPCALHQGKWNNGGPKPRNYHNILGTRKMAESKFHIIRCHHTKFIHPGLCIPMGEWKYISPNSQPWT